MKVIACSGFPVPVSRYWSEFPAVEISETENGLPGPGTVRRWLREAPDGYGFSVVAPKVVAESGFAPSPENLAIIKEVSAFIKTIHGRAIVFVAPNDWKESRANRSAIKAFAEWLPPRGGPYVIDIPSWPTQDLRALTKGTTLQVAFDPITVPPLKEEKNLCYMRLPGPAGHRSRYDDVALEKVAQAVIQAKSQAVFCTFANIDMFANAKRTIQLIRAAIKNEK